jgi:hypothetical protein
MWWRKTRLVRLYEELEILAILDRLVHASHANSDRGDNEIHIFRERRQSEVLAEIAKLERGQTETRNLWVSGVALLSVLLYATFHYVLR